MLDLINRIPLAYFQLSGLVNFFTSFAICLFIIANNRTKRINIIFSLFCLSVAQFSFFYFLWLISKNEFYSDFFIRTCMAGVIFMPSLFTHFVFYLINAKPRPRLIFANYAISFILLSFLYTDLYAYGGDRFLVFPFWPYPGKLFPVHLSHFFLNVLYSHYKMIRVVRDKYAPELLRTQIKYVFYGTFIGYCAGVTNYLCWYRVPVAPVLNILISAYVALVAYSIVKHQLLDIEVIIKRTAVFAGLFAFVYGTFSVVTILGQEFFKNYFGWSQWVATIPTVMIITLFLKPLESFLTNATERFLFQKKYNYRDLLRTFTNEVLTVLDLQKLTEQTILGLNKLIKLESASMLLYNSDLKKYLLASSLGIKDKSILFSENDALISYLKQTHQHILKDKSADEMAGHSSLRDDFRNLNAQLCLPITHHDELIGVLSLGMKKSGEEFTQEDTDILMTLARTLGIAIANAQLFDQLSKTQAEAAQREKMAVIGTLAAGINHEICNPLGIVRGQCEMYLLNLRDGLYSKKSMEEMNVIASDIMNKVIKETDRATAITKKLSGFAKPAKKSESEEVNVEKEADEVLGLIGHDLRLNNIEFKKDFPATFAPIYADKRQIQEVLFNIIRNAAQAMEKDKKDGWISLSGALVNGSAVLKISDNGSGIPADKLGQIFNPFFTTKEPGKGTGLGLFIVKQVIERNKGTIAVESQEGVGTTFTLTFPVADNAKVLAA